MKVVVNTSPLILLAKIHRLQLLARLYQKVMIPAAVWEELSAKPGSDSAGIQAFCEAQGIIPRRPAQRWLRSVPLELGKGEREVIGLALEKRADLAILDDEEARRLARAEGLSVTGTIGVLVEARERDEIPSLRRELDRLIESGMWVTEVFYHQILRGCGEGSRQHDRSGQRRKAQTLHP